MAGTNYVVLYDLAEPGDVLGMWIYATSHNATSLTDGGNLTVDGTDVAENIDTAKVAAFAKSNPTAVITTMERKCCIVTFNGPMGAPDDVIERSAGSRDPDPIYQYSR